MSDNNLMSDNNISGGDMGGGDLSGDTELRHAAAVTRRSGASNTSPRPLPGVWPASRARSKVELLSFFRNRQSLVFTLLFPVLLLVVFGSIFSGKVEGTPTDFKQVFIAGIIAAGIMSVSFQGLSINIAIERDSGLLRRLGSTPMPKTAYFAGKVVRVAVTAVLEVAVLLAIAVPAFGLPLPSTAGRWFTLAWVGLLGAMACSLLAVAYSWVIPNSASAPAIVTPPFMVLQFISGVFFPFHQLPAWMQSLAGFFPLKWMAQGLRSVFLPDSFTVVEPAGTWEHGRTAMVLVIWCVAGALLSATTFRWRGAKVG
jgi:ABC-2 type transport system permease protein